MVADETEGTVGDEKGRTAEDESEETADAGKQSMGYSPSPDCQLRCAPT